MDQRAFVKATVEFVGPGVVVGDEVIDGDWNPVYVQLEGPWVHIVRDNTGPTTTVYTVPQGAIQAITWERGYRPPPE